MSQSKREAMTSLSGSFTTLAASGRHHGRALVRYALIGSVIGVSACATTAEVLSVSEVKPWERGTLARDDMQLVNDVMEQQVDDHIYFSKEASTGGVSVQGGGCGCN